MKIFCCIYSALYLQHLKKDKRIVLTRDLNTTAGLVVSAAFDQMT
jgi:hypothetical protein